MQSPNEGLKESLAWHDDDEYRNWVSTNKVGSLEGKQRGLFRRGKILGCV
jgi:hypothetical protein